MAEADAIWTAPHRRAAAVLDPDEAADARAAAALRAAAGELRGLAAADPALVGSPSDVLAALADVPVREPGAPGAVLVADPLEIRARRFRAVFVCGLQEGAFPRHPVPEPFLDDAARASLARASGLVLPRHEDVLARERYLLYAAVSRPEEVLFLSFRSSDEEGDPALPSAFVDDVRALFTDELWERRGRRLLADVTWPPGAAPTPHELRRARAAAEERPEPPPLGAPTTAPALAVLAARETEAARGLETFAGCGVRWLVDSVLRPERAEPDPEPMRRGSIAHAVLEQTLRRLQARAGSARLTPDSLPAALEELAAAMAARRAEAAGTRARALAARARGRPAAAARATRRSAAPGSSRAGSSGASVARATSTARCRSQAPASVSPAGSTGSTSTPPAARWCATTRAGRSAPARAGRATTSSRSPSTRSRCASCWASRRSARCTSRSATATSARAGWCATTCRAAT